MAFYPESERLQLFPATADHLMAYAKRDGSLEHILGLTFIPGHLSDAVQKKIRNHFIPAVIRHEDAYRFYTIWFMLDKRLGMHVGGICFKGEPDENGWVEIGYETFPPFQNKGYMSEAVELLCEWARETGEVFGVRALTGSNNEASKKVLLISGFAEMRVQNENCEFELIL